VKGEVMLEQIKQDYARSGKNIAACMTVDKLDWLLAEVERLRALCENLVGEEKLHQDGQCETEMTRLREALADAQAAARWYFAHGGTFRAEQALETWPWLGHVDHTGPVPVGGWKEAAEQAGEEG
jgi:hypothetical protein